MIKYGMCELLSPVGNIECLDAAVAAGCDAVYLGLKTFNARERATNFTFTQLAAAADSLHKRGKKIYVAVNTVVAEDESERLYRLLHFLVRVGVDALIVQDFSIIRMAQEFFPSLALHASTQMNVQNAEGVQLLQKAGVKRVVLSRELSLCEIDAIKKATGAELEIFIHGALCISESGLCMFSSALGGKSANRGQCAQACRRLYTAACAGGDKDGYYFSPRDLCLIEQLPDILACGVDSLKIEGRLKSAEYVHTVTSAYRYVIDNYQADKRGAIEAGKRILAGDFGREKTTYFFDKESEGGSMACVVASCLDPSQAGGTGIHLGKVAKIKGGDPRLVFVQGANYEVSVGDTVRLHSKDDTGRISHKVTTTQTIDGQFYFDADLSTKVGDEVYLLQIKSNTKRHPPVLPKNLSQYKVQPRDERLPILDLSPLSKPQQQDFPEGVYVCVSSISDVFVAKSFNPVRLLIEYNSDTAPVLLGTRRTVLPFSKKQIFIVFDPFLPQDSEERFTKNAATLLENGYTNFVANNLAHLAILRTEHAKINQDAKKGASLNIVAGQYLYTFNRWAASFLENNGADTFIVPYENSQKNLVATFEKNMRSKVLLCVFSYPVLFRIRMLLGESYDFTYFSDKTGASFRLTNSPDGSFVSNELPFSILDKLNDLSRLGFKRYLLDFSKTQITKNQVRAIIASMQKGTPLPDATRFNWQHGFFVKRDNSK